MRFVTLWYVKRFCTAFIKTSAQCGFAEYCLKRYLQFLRGCKAAFYRWLSDGELVGSVAAFSGSTLPAGWLLCDGSAVSRETYAVLFTIIGTTYGNGDGSTTFNLPNLIDKFVEGSATAGTVKSAGLPNIVGSFNKQAVAHNGWNDATGCFNWTFGVAEAVGTGTESACGYMDFDASRSSSIYGNSTTVQPPALTMRFAIFAGHSALFRWIRQS